MVKSGRGAATAGRRPRAENGDILTLRIGRRYGLGLSLATSIFLAGTALAQNAPAQPTLIQPPPTQTVAHPAPPATARHRKTHETAPKPLVLPPMPAGPLSQMPMDQIPATPAKVSFQGGLLSISAQNSTLGEILRDVRRLTGATIDIPAAGANERVVTHLGPGAPRDVLVGLLNGSSFNYVMVGSNTDPTAVSSVILTAKPPSGDAPQAAQTAANVYQGNPGQAPPSRFPFNPVAPIMGGPAPGQPAPAEDEAKDDDQEAADDNASADDQAQPGVQPEQPGVNAQQPQQPDANLPNAGPKTPEQIMEMLRRQQQPGGAVAPAPQPPPEQ
jgi:hypothetical protein